MDRMKLGEVDANTSGERDAVHVALYTTTICRRMIGL